MRYKKSQTTLLELLPLNILERIAEIKFYRICEKFYKIQGELSAVFNFIECLGILGTFNIEALKLIAQKMMYNSNMEPSKYELILLMALEGMPSAQIAETAHCSKRDITYVINNAESKLKIARKTSETEIKEILRFMGVFETLQNIKYK